MKLKYILASIMFTTSVKAATHTPAPVNVMDSQALTVTHITMSMLESKIPSFRNLWTKRERLDDGVVIYKQDGLFSLDDVAYRDVEISHMPARRSGYQVMNSASALQSTGVLTNKIRMMAGIAPVSNHDNKPVMLCRLENHIEDTFYEMTASQFATFQTAFPANYAMGHLCTTAGSSRSYWKNRLNDFYDEFGNKR